MPRDTDYGIDLQILWDELPAWRKYAFKRARRKTEKALRKQIQEANKSFWKEKAAQLHCPECKSGDVWFPHARLAENWPHTVKCRRCFAEFEAMLTWCEFNVTKSGLSRRKKSERKVSDE